MQENIKIGLKYCGGCNPNYERGTIVARASADYPDVCFAPYDPNEAYTLVLIICGCLEECFAFHCPNAKHGTISIRALEEYQTFGKFMTNLR